MSVNSDKIKRNKAKGWAKERNGVTIFFRLWIGHTCLQQSYHDQAILEACTLHQSERQNNKITDINSVLGEKCNVKNLMKYHKNSNVVNQI